MPSSRKKEEADQSQLNDLISLQDAAKLSGLSQTHLRLLVRNHEVWGKKIGRNWVTTEQAVREYQARAQRPGRKPRTGT
jgi:hypothetical protein